MTESLARPEFVGDVISQHSFGEALSATARMIAGCDTKWPDFLLPTAQVQLLDNLLSVSLHLRRVCEASSKKMKTQIINEDFKLNRDFSDFETDLWTAVNRIVHHHKLSPQILSQRDFYQTDNKTMASHLIADVEVESDRGVSRINVAGFAVACTNELGAQSVTPRKVFH